MCNLGYLNEDVDDCVHRTKGMIQALENMICEARLNWVC